MDDVVIPIRGAIMAPLFAEVVRALTREDLVALAQNPEPVQLAPTQKLRSVHHRMAALLADGKTNKEVAAICSYTEARVVQLKKDPAFQELVGYYHDQIITAQLNDSIRIQAKLVDAAEMALDQIIQRLEDDEEIKKMPVGELRQITTMGTDRTVAPPKATTSIVAPPQTITLNFGGKGIREVSERSMPVIDQPPSKE